MGAQDDRDDRVIPGEVVVPPATTDGTGGDGTGGDSTGGDGRVSGRRRGGEPLEGSVVANLTPEQVMYLVRWGLGELAVGRLDAAVLPYAALSLLVAVVMGVLAALVAHGVGAALLIIFAVLFTISALITLAFRFVARRLILQTAVPAHLRPAFRVLTSGTGWRRRLRSELRRVGLPDGPFALLGTLGAIRGRQRLGARGRPTAADLGALRDIRLDEVFGYERLQEAQRRFDQAQEQRAASASRGRG